MVTKIKIFLSYDMRTKLLLLEAVFFLGWARILKKFSFEKTAKSLGLHIGESSFSRVGLDVKVLKNVSNSVHIMERYTIWESKCLVKAIAAMKMLERRKIESTLYLGTGKDENGRLVAHAWLRSGPYYITGADGMEKYTVIGMFAKKFSHENLKGEGNG